MMDTAIHDLEFEILRDKQLIDQNENHTERCLLQIERMKVDNANAKRRIAERQSAIDLLKEA